MTWPSYPGVDQVQAVAAGAAERWGALDPAARAWGSAETWVPEPHQVPPRGRWFGWLMLAGRGSGKSAAMSAWIDDHTKGPPCLPGAQPHRIAIIAPTQGDAVDACVSGPSGLQAHNPAIRLLPSAPGGTSAVWPNGSRARLFGAREPEDVERLRAGGNTCRVWLEELAAMRYLGAVYDQAMFGLRVGPDPRWGASTTPKARPEIKKLDREGVEVPHDSPLPFNHRVVITRAQTDDNPHLVQHIRDALYDAYGGKTIGQQELLGRIIDQDESALWRREDLDVLRVLPADVPDLPRISVGVDPSGGAGVQGIVVVGRWSHREPSRRAGRPPELVTEGFTLADRSCRLSPAGWGTRAVQAAIDHEADDVVVEVNFGGDMAVATIRGAADVLGVDIPVRQVRASRGKRARAEPVAALSDPSRARWHLAGTFPELEDELCTWTDDSGYSPDRLDAMVWPAWHLKIVSVHLVGVAQFPGSALAKARVS